MPTLRHHLRRLSWIALLAIFGLALAPTISHALASATTAGGSWAEVCTPEGTRLVALDGSANAAPESAPVMSHFDHCPLCGVAGQALGLPPAPPAVEQPLGLVNAVPALFLQAPRPLFAWASAQPRGPPAA